MCQQVGRFKDPSVVTHGHNRFFMAWARGIRPFDQSYILSHDHPLDPDSDRSSRNSVGDVGDQEGVSSQRWVSDP